MREYCKRLCKYLSKFLQTVVLWLCSVAGLTRLVASFRRINEEYYRYAEPAELPPEHIGWLQNRPSEMYRPGWVYLIKASDGFYKIGCSSQPERRIKAISTQFRTPVETICIIPVESMLPCERYLHDLFHDKRVYSEWFDLAPDEVNFIRGINRLVLLETEGEQ